MLDDFRTRNDITIGNWKQMVDFLLFLQGTQNLKFLFGYCAHQSPTEMGSTLKEKNLLPWEVNSFLLD